MPYLVLIQLTVFVLRFTLLLEGYNDKPYEDVHHEEGYEDEIDDEENGDAHAIIVYGAHVLSVGVNCFVQQPVGDSTRATNRRQGQEGIEEVGCDPCRHRTVGG